jgi:hypothetical protein
MLQQILGYLITALGILMVLFFSNHSGEAIPFPILWYILGIALIPTGAAISAAPKLKKLKRRLAAKRRKEHNELELFKRKSTKIKLTVDDWRVTEALRTIMFECEVEYKGEKRYFKRQLDGFADVASARFTLEQKELYIYINNYDPEKYHLELNLDEQ